MGDRLMIDLKRLDGKLTFVSSFSFSSFFYLKTEAAADTYFPIWSVVISFQVHGADMKANAESRIPTSTDRISADR
jgi:hypothetical protein